MYGDVGVADLFFDFLFQGLCDMMRFIHCQVLTDGEMKIYDFSGS